MALGLIVFDVVMFSLATALYGGAFLAAARVHMLLSERAPAPIAYCVATLTAVLVLIAEVAILVRLLPRLREGRYSVLKDSQFFVWALHSVLRRILFFPGLKTLIFSSSVLRFLALRALGARVAFSSNMSSDVDLLDPALLTVERGSTMGARTLITGHIVFENVLTLGRVYIGEGAQLGAESTLGPSTSVGKGALLKLMTSLGIGVTVGDGARVGPWSTLNTGASVGARAVVGANANVPRGVRVADGERYDGLRLPETPP